MPRTTFPFAMNVREWNKMCWRDVFVFVVSVSVMPLPAILTLSTPNIAFSPVDALRWTLRAASSTRRLTCPRPAWIVNHARPAWVRIAPRPIAELATVTATPATPLDACGVRGVSGAVGSADSPGGPVAISPLYWSSDWFSLSKVEHTSTPNVPASLVSYAPVPTTAPDESRICAYVVLSSLAVDDTRTLILDGPETVTEWTGPQPPLGIDPSIEVVLAATPAPANARKT